MESPKKVFELIAAAVSGGGLATLFNYLISLRSSKRDDFAALIGTFKTDNERLRTENEEIEAELMILRNEVAGLRNKIVLLESAHIDAPIPMWLKDLDGTMLALNTAYEEVYLIPQGLTARDYIGRKDSDIWPKEIAEAFLANDRKVISTGKPIRIRENTGVFGSHLIIKYLRSAGGIRLGVAGISFPFDSEQTN